MLTKRYEFTSLILVTLFFNTYTTATDSFKHSLQTGLLPSLLAVLLLSPHKLF